MVTLSNYFPFFPCPAQAPGKIATPLTKSALNHSGQIKKGQMMSQSIPMLDNRRRFPIVFLFRPHTHDSS
jgi:hypothetical protein